MKIAIVSVGAFVLATACVDKQAMLVHPVSKQVQYCNNKGWGWAGAPIASSEHRKCVESLRALGYRFPHEINSNLTENNSSIDPVVNSISSEMVSNSANTAAATTKYKNVREAKFAYESGAITKVEYKDAIFELKAKYERAVFDAKKELEQGLIDKYEYKRRIAVARSAYEG